MKKLLSIALATLIFASTVAFVPAQAAGEFQAGTVFSTYAGEEITLLPDYSTDMSQDLALLRDGGFETKAAFNDDLQATPYWTGGGMTFDETDAVEGKTSLIVDFPKINKDARGEAGFISVFLAPCFKGEAYCLEFYTKLLTPLDGNPNIMIYFMDTNNNNASPSVSIGVDRFSINADTMRGTEWENQKWVRVRHYFVTDENMNESAYTMQIQNMNMDGPWGTSRIALDAFSLKKVYIDEKTMDPSLFSQPDPVTPKSVKFKKSKISIKKGKPTTLKVTVKGAKKATFSVDKKGKKVVKLSKKKAKSVVVTGKKKGKATITAKVGNKKATCKVTVK